MSTVAGRLKPADTGTLLPALNYLCCCLSLSPAHCTDRGDWYPPTPPQLTLILSGSPWLRGWRALNDQCKDGKRALLLPASESRRAIKSHLVDKGGNRRSHNVFICRSSFSMADVAVARLIIHNLWRRTESCAPSRGFHTLPQTEGGTITCLEVLHLKSAAELAGLMCPLGCYGGRHTQQSQ